ncbi:MAG: hypothetical protein NVSMB1_09290 [Polyangiales bacterium]
MAALLLVATQGLSACTARAVDPQDSDEVSAAIGAVQYERFPSRANITQAVVRFRAEGPNARAAPPMRLSTFLGHPILTLGMADLHIELLKSDPLESDKPLAFLYARYWLSERGDTQNHPDANDRFKDVRLLHLTDELKSPASPFPEAGPVQSTKYFERYSAVLIRIWTDFHALKRGEPPHGLSGDSLLTEIARIGVWSFVTGNLDGPATNGENGGFARFKDASGREFWRGVLIDNGAALTVNARGNEFTEPYLGRLVKPWDMDLLNTGGIERRSIPADVVHSVKQIAGASNSELSSWMMFDSVPHANSAAIVNQVRANAKEVIDHYRLSNAP